MPHVYRNPRHHFIPVDPPPHEAIMAACRVLQDQERAVYQRLYASGLTSPGHPAAPFEVRRSVEHLASLEVQLHMGYPVNGYTFLVLMPEELDDLIAKCEAIIEAVEADKQRVHSMACCPLATFRPCFCNVSFACILHGIHCYGTHD